MNHFINDIRSRFGDGASLVCEMWINFYIFRSNREPEPDYVDFVKKQMKLVIGYTRISTQLFNLIVKESDTFLQKAGHTIH